MMLLLDSEALSAIAHGPLARRHRVRSLISEARRREERITAVATTLTEVVRGRPADAAVYNSLRREHVFVRPVDQDIAVRAGHLLESVGAGSELAVDAFVVAAADLFGRAVIATVDTEDMRLLASRCPAIQVASINPG